MTFTIKELTPEEVRRYIEGGIKAKTFQILDDGLVYDSYHTREEAQKVIKELVLSGVIRQRFYTMVKRFVTSTIQNTGLSKREIEEIIDYQVF